MSVILCVVGPKNSGKTSVIEQLVKWLKSRQIRVATAKHTAHEHLFDREGSDSWRQGQAGADHVGLFSPGQVVSFDYGVADTDAAFADWLKRVRPSCDVILIEGLRHSGYPKLLLMADDINDYDVSEPVTFRLKPQQQKGQKPQLSKDALETVVVYFESA